MELEVQRENKLDVRDREEKEEEYIDEVYGEEQEDFYALWRKAYAHPSRQI